MPESHSTRRLDIRIFGLEAESQMVPASVLAQIVEGMQRTLYLLAMNHEQ
jgi:hypothetical protein